METEVTIIVKGGRVVGFRSNNSSVKIQVLDFDNLSSCEDQSQNRLRFEDEVEKMSEIL